MFSRLRSVVSEICLIDIKNRSIPIGTLISNTHLHPNVAVIAPPNIIPEAEPKPVTAAKILKARFLSLPSGKAATRIDSPAAEAIAVPSLEQLLQGSKQYQKGQGLLSTR